MFLKSNEIILSYCKKYSQNFIPGIFLLYQTVLTVLYQRLNGKMQVDKMHDYLLQKLPKSSEWNKPC